MYWMFMKNYGDKVKEINLVGCLLLDKIEGILKLFDLRNDIKVLLWDEDKYVNFLIVI